jgi:hypothetical protein
MIKQLQKCWAAMNPEKPAAKGKGKAKPTTRKKKATPQSESSEEEPLASQAAVKEKKKRATKAAVKKADKPVALTVEQLNLEFEKMFLEPDNYIKVLRYEVCGLTFCYTAFADFTLSSHSISKNWLPWALKEV